DPDACTDRRRRLGRALRSGFATRQAGRARRAMGNTAGRAAAHRWYPDPERGTHPIRDRDPAWTVDPRLWTAGCHGLRAQGHPEGLAAESRRDASGIPTDDRVGVRVARARRGVRLGVVAAETAPARAHFLAPGRDRGAGC